jgi:transposase-like protein
MNLNSREVEVNAEDGSPAKALLFSCPECNCEEFLLFSLIDAKGDTKHPHFQCADCQTSFCDGTCTTTTPTSPTN